MGRRDAAGVPVGERGRGGEPWDSALSVQEFAAVGGVGFDPVGLVLGTAAFHVGYTSDSECSYRRLSSRSLTVTASRWTPFTGLVDSMYAVRTTALDRMVSECRVRGGDGVVGVTLRAREFPSGTLEFTITGTAVRARSRVRPRRPFTSHLSGQDFARLMHSGWVPTGLAFGISMASRHGTQGTIRQTRRTAGNQEVDGYTGLVSDVRRAARAQLTRAARKNGGDGLVVGDMELRVHEEDCSRGAKDRVAEALIVGTSIARFARPGRQTAPEPLTVMRLER